MISSVWKSGSNTGLLFSTSCAPRKKISFNSRIILLTRWEKETWNIPVYSNTNIPGYNPLVSKLRDLSDRNTNNIGRGVAICVDDQLDK